MLRSVQAVAVGLLSIAACHRPVASPLTVAELRASTQGAPGPRNRTHGVIARRVPGFAGMYIGDSLDMVVVLAPRGSMSTARQVLEPYMREHQAARYGAERAARLKFIVRRAEFEYLQLEDWKLAIMHMGQGLAPYSGVGVDERANRVTLHVAGSGADSVPWRRTLIARGIPARAVAIEYGGIPRRGAPPP